jgi:hypothetical protein
MWQSMIVYALDHKAWNPSVAISYDVDSAVVRLLAFDHLWNSIFRVEENAAVFATLEETYARALAYWGASPMVVSGFAALAVLPAAKALLLPGIKWMLPAIKEFDSYDWKYGLEGNVIDFLHACWTRQRDQISADATLREAFLAILAVVTSRGSPAAIVLNKRVADSIGT